MNVPERLAWAVETLNVEPADQLLELGCGRGVAVALVCAKLTDGRIVAVDRSATATAAAEQRNAEHITAGRAAIQTATLETADLSGARFDKVFAVNVNLFWTGPARRELAVIKDILKPSGALYLFYEPPTGARTSELAGRVSATLEEAGYSTAAKTARTTRTPSLLCVLGRPT